MFAKFLETSTSSLIKNEKHENENENEISLTNSSNILKNW